VGYSAELGRRIRFEDVAGQTTTRYYYDGQNAVEERDGQDAVVRYHVHGSQYIDERVATYPAQGDAVYYLERLNHSVIATGDPDGSSILRLDYSAFGQFTGGGSASGSYYHDYDGDLDVDMVDFINFQTCFGSATQACKDVHDSDSDNDIDLDDFEDLLFCFGGPFVTPDPNCGTIDPNSGGASTGTFASLRLRVAPDGPGLCSLSTCLRPPRRA